MTNRVIDYSVFINTNCSEKNKIAGYEWGEIEYVYSKPFNRKGFELIDVSKEGFYLYEVVN